MQNNSDEKLKMDYMQTTTEKEIKCAFLSFLIIVKFAGLLIFKKKKKKIDNTSPDLFKHINM